MTTISIQGGEISVATHGNIPEGGHHNGLWRIARHMQSRDDGKRAIPNHKRRATTNSGPGMERSREICGTALSHQLLVPEEWDKAVRRARS